MTMRKKSGRPEWHWEGDQNVDGTFIFLYRKCYQRRWRRCHPENITRYTERIKMTLGRLAKGVK
jgi:hypothetical protein